MLECDARQPLTMVQEEAQAAGQSDMKHTVVVVERRGWWHRISRGERVRTVIAAAGAVVVLAGVASDLFNHGSRSALLVVGGIVLAFVIVWSLITTYRQRKRDATNSAQDGN